MTSNSNNTVMCEIKNSYPVWFLILTCLVVLQLGLEFQLEFFESNLIPSFLIVVFPLGVSAYSFAVSRIYNGSKIFGRSYFALGLGYFAVFMTESLHLYYYDILKQEVPEVTSYFLFSFYPLLLIHMTINIRYFAERLEPFQKITMIFVPVLFILLYTFLVFSNTVEDISYFYYSLIFVSLTSVQVGFVIVGFSLFRQTALFGAWFLLLIGITIGTIGDIVYYYVQIIEENWATNVTSLWIGSNMIMIYALYRHQKAM